MQSSSGDWGKCYYCCEKIHIHSYETAQQGGKCGVKLAVFMADKMKYEGLEKMAGVIRRYYNVLINIHKTAVKHSHLLIWNGIKLR